MIVVELTGVPQGVARPRFVRRSGVAFTPAHTRNYQAALRLAAQEVMEGKPLLTGPVSLAVTAAMPIPSSWSLRKRQAARDGLLKPTTRPDFENLAKQVDAFNLVVWRDDAQVVIATITKIYSDKPALRFEISEVKP